MARLGAGSEWERFVAAFGEMKRPQPMLFEPDGRVHRL
jgi:hypothetical protein